MKVCVILSDDYKRKLKDITRYQNLVLATTLFQLYKQQANGDYIWLASRVTGELIGVHADLMYTVPMTLIKLLETGRFEPHYVSDVIPVLQYNLTRLLS